MKEKDITFLKNAVTNKQCYNCALRKKCEKENPALFEPIGTCGKWINEVNGQINLRYESKRRKD